MSSQNNLHRKRRLSAFTTIYRFHLHLHSVSLHSESDTGQCITESVCVCGCQGPDHLCVNPVLTGLESDHRVHGVSETCTEVGGQPLIWLKVVCCARGSALMLPTEWHQAVSDLYEAASYRVVSQLAGKRRSWLCYERTPQLVDDKNPINFTSAVIPEGSVLFCTTWGSWTRGAGDIFFLFFFFFFYQEVPAYPSQCKAEQSCPEVIMLAGWPERRRWWRWKRKMFRMGETQELQCAFINILPRLKFSKCLCCRTHKT